jgi:hypothetical protein
MSKVLAIFSLVSGLIIGWSSVATAQFAVPYGSFNRTIVNRTIPADESIGSAAKPAREHRSSAQGVSQKDVTARRIHGVKTNETY